MVLKCRVFDADGTFTAPATVSAVILQKVGPGGGGQGHGGIGTGGSGLAASSAEFCLNKFVPVTPGGTIAITVGTGGLGILGAGSRPTGGTGSATFGSSIALRAKSGNLSDNGQGNGCGYGGGVLGGSGNSYLDAIGFAESVSYFGGTGGTDRNSAGVFPGVIVPSNADSTGGANGANGDEPGGSGGAAAVWPTGGDGGIGRTVAGPIAATDGVAATGWGAGGGSAGASAGAGGPLTGGNGKAGAVLVYYCEE